MAEAFYWFLNMNIVASLCGLVILLVGGAAFLNAYVRS